MLRDTKHNPGGPEIYWGEAERVIGRALSMLDIEATSGSFGSFDRTWWNWKFTDFPAPRFQEGIFLLAWLFDSPNAPKIMYGNERLLERVGAVLRFWQSLQHHDGAFDEAYPYERCLAATAFTGFYVGSALERLSGALSPDAEDSARKAIERTSIWLRDNGEYHGVLSNHLAAAAGALQIAGDLFGTDKFREARNRYLGIIYDNQDPDEGWMREYGGADPGYQSHAMFYLAEIYRRSKDTTLRASIDAGCEFLAHFAHPDGTMGGEYASRGTKFAYPAAFEMLANDMPMAASIACHLRTTISAGRGILPAVSDAWNLFPLLNNFLFACDAASATLEGPDLPWVADGSARFFPRAGLTVASAGGRLLVTAQGRGGAMKLWSKSNGQLIYEDCGYAASQGNRWLVSQSLSDAQFVEDDELLSVCSESTFETTPSLRFDPWRFIGFRLFTLSVGRVPAAARLIKALLVSLLIRNRRRSETKLVRRISFCEDGALSIDDRLEGVSDEVIAVARQVPIHMGSSRYADMTDWVGAVVAPGNASPPDADGVAMRLTTLRPGWEQVVVKPGEAGPAPT